MARSTFFNHTVQFGDCDPAGIVFFPNFHRWMDAASLNFFLSCGIPPWREYEKTTGIIGTPMLEHTTRFIQSATYAELLTIETRLESVAAKTFVQLHQVRRGETLLCESRETRIFTRRDPATGRLHGVPFPEDVRQACFT